MKSIFINLKSVMHLLSKKDVNYLFILSFLILLTTVFETLSLSMIVPLVSFIGDVEFIENYPVIFDILSKFSSIFDLTTQNFTETQKLMLGTSFIFSLFFLLRHIFFLIVTWKKEDFKFKMKTNFSDKMYSGYLKLPYSFHLKNNSSILVRNAVQEVEIFTNNVMQLITVFSDLILITFLISMLLFFESKITIYIILFLSFLSSVFLILTRKKIFSLAKERQQNDRKSFFYAKQGLEAIKEINISGRQNEFADQYISKYSKLSKIVFLQNFINFLPRVWLEVFVFISLIIFLFFSHFQNNEMTKIIPILALYVGTAFRLLPGINRIVVSINALKLGLPAVKVLQEEIDLFNKQKENLKYTGQSETRFEKSLKLKNIFFDYEKSKSILKGINIEILKGSTIGIMGSSGSGKSTFIDVLTGLLRPNKGEVLVDEQNIYLNLKSWRKKLGYVPQNIYLLDDTIKNNIAFGIQEHLIDQKLINEALNKAGLNKFIKELPNGVETNVGERGTKLSGGQAQRIALARALYNKPSVLILDEATNSLDINKENQILETIKTNLKDITVIIVSHRENTVKICDKVYKISDGILKEINL